MADERQLTSEEIATLQELQRVAGLPPVKIAFVIDGVVVDVLHTDARLGAIFLSNPTIIDVTTWSEENPGKNLVKATYTGSSFVLSPTEPAAIELPYIPPSL